MQISGIEKDETFPKEILPLYERVKVEDVPHKPDVYGDFTLGRVEQLKDKYKLRVIVRYEKKFDCAVIDAEIGGKRTLTSIRVNSLFKGLFLTTKCATVESEKLYKVK